MRYLASLLAAPCVLACSHPYTRTSYVSCATSPDTASPPHLSTHTSPERRGWRRSSLHQRALRVLRVWWLEWLRASEGAKEPLLLLLNGSRQDAQPFLSLLIIG